MPSSPVPAGAFACVATILVLGCGRAPQGVADFVLADPNAWWFSGDFVQMVPPVHMPSPESEQEQVEVWLHSGDLGVVQGDDGVARLKFGGVTAADRIEWNGQGAARRIVDVRGTHIDHHGQCTHHVLRPQDENPGAALTGMQWPCDDATAQAWVDAQMRERLAALPPFSRMTPQRRTKALDGFVQRNDCDGCHRESRVDSTRVGALGPVERGTDASGFFAPQSVLRDEQPLEAYGAVDPNVDDPSITVRCADGPATKAEVRHGLWRWRCPDEQVPLARVDWEILRQANPERLAAICASRRYLIERLGARASAFPGALEPCG